MVFSPPRHNKERIVREATEMIPAGLHVHGFALRAYSHISRIDSFDSTNWFRDAMRLHLNPDLQHLTPGERLEIIVKRYQREGRKLRGEETIMLPFDD